MQDQLEQIEISIEEAKKTVAMKEALHNLLDNKDFKAVIEEGYFEKEASRVVLLKSDPEMQDEKSQKQLDHTIIAIGSLRQYFRTIMQLGYMAERSIADDEATREDLLAEEIING